MASAEHKDNGPHILLDNSSLRTNATIEELKLAWKKSRKIKKKKKQCEAAEQKDKGSSLLLDNSSVRTDTDTKEVNSSGKQKKVRKKKKQCEPAEQKDKGASLLLDYSSVRTDTNTKEVNSSGKKKKAQKKKKQGKAFENKDKGPQFSVDNYSLKTDATLEDLKLGCNQSGAKKRKQCEAVDHKDKGSHFSPNNSSLNTDVTSKEVNSSRKRKREGKKKKQGKAIEHEDKGSQFSQDNSSLKIDATEEVNSSQKRKRAKKKKKQCEAIEHNDKGPHFLLDNYSVKTDASSKEVNSSQKQKRKRKKKKQGKAVEHKDIGSHVSLNNSSLKTDATTEELNSSWKHKRERKKTKQGKGIEHKHEGSYFPVDNSSLKTDATTEDPLHEPPALPALLSSQEIVEFSLKKKNKKRKKQKTKHHAIENIVNCCSPPNDAFSSKSSTPALHRPSELPIQFVPIDPVAEQSCVETDVCQAENEEKEQFMTKVENSNGECDVQELSCSCNTAVANAECSANESVLEVVIINSSSDYKDNSDFVNNASPAKNLDYSAVQHTTKTFQSDKTYTSTKRVNSNHGRNNCYPSSVVQLEEANGTQQGYIDTRGNDMCCAADDVSDFSSVSKTGGQSEIPHLPLSRTITRKHYSKNKLLILDVNGLLADFASRVPRGSKPPDIYINGKKVYKRPFCDDFIQFCLNKFHVGVWSSRAKRNLDKAIKFLFGKSASKLLFCWNQSHCTKTKSFTLEDKHKPLVFKDLRKLWDKTVPSLPWEKGEFNESNTILLDDSPYKALLNPRYTAIFPYSYHFTDTDDRSLGREGDLRVYLKGLAMAENIQAYVSSNPFGQEAITETNPSWDFYSEIIEAVKRRQNDAEMWATSSRQRSRNRSSTRTDQGTACQPPSTIEDPPQKMKALPPPVTGDPPQQTEAIRDPPQQTGALPPPATRDSPHQTKVLLPPAIGDPPQQTKALPPPAAGDSPKQSKASHPIATGDPQQHTEAMAPPATGDPPQQTKVSPSPATRDSPQRTTALLPPTSGDLPQQTKALPPPATVAMAVPP